MLIVGVSLLALLLSQHGVISSLEYLKIRSESRTDETSGFVVTMASSAKYNAIRAPVSIPAGESQIIKSNPISAMSFKTRSTPSRLSASLSRVCEAGSTYRLSTRLSLISAWFKFASPFITLTKS